MRRIEGAVRRREGAARRREAPSAHGEPVARRERDRRALSHVGGAVEFSGGTPEEQRALGAALKVSSNEDTTQAHVHGFHSYPARLHPLTARGLIEGFSKPGARVLDPFCGSGTVLVEARLAGREALGVDVNPLAIELSNLKTNGPGDRWLERLPAVARRVAEHADERRQTRAGATRRYSDEDVALFAPHVLLELDGLRDGIAHVESDPVRRALLLVLSAVLTKVSVRAGDTGRAEGTKHLPSGYATRFFLKKADELSRRLADATELLPERAPLATVVHADARDLHGVGDRVVDLVVSSPPYPGVYDYVVHHRDRLRWLDLPEDRFEAHEIGARRHARGVSFERAVARFRGEFGAAFAEIGRVLAPGGAAVLVIADSVLGGQAVYTDELLRGLAPAARLTVACVASQLRPHVHAPTQQAFAERPRREHAILLKPDMNPHARRRIVVEPRRAR
ncbi:MAG TPA: DNA methyltransferase [Polyangiaceae bacterium]|nr:DNA methyltransferase [Polyangiaceae bacterium]